MDQTIDVFSNSETIFCRTDVNMRHLLACIYLHFVLFVLFLKKKHFKK